MDEAQIQKSMTKAFCSAIEPIAEKIAKQMAEQVSHVMQAQERELYLNKQISGSRAIKEFGVTRGQLGSIKYVQDAHDSARKYRRLDIIDFQQKHLFSPRSGAK